MKNKPLLICMTPVRNEAWVLHAFLKATSLWADYIIIADQMSIDGSREIALSYPKVILIENNNPDFNEADRQKLLIDKAREIKGDKILFGLDADELLAANFANTEDWQKILNSKPGDVFWFKWAEIRPDLKTYWESEKTYYPWVFHDDNIEPHGNYVRNMHSMRIPYPIEEKQMYYVNDFRVLHLAHISVERVNAKRRFYQFVDWTMNKRSVVKLSRTYMKQKNEPIFELESNQIDFTDQYGFSVFENIELKDNHFWFDDYIVEKVKYLPRQIYRLNIWNVDFLKKYNLKDNRGAFTKILHLYLFKTQKISQKKLVKLIDKILSFLC